MEDVETLKKEIIDYKSQLCSNKNKWLIQQIKHGILMGNLGLRICVIPKSGYKKAKHLFNFWKEINSKYYFKELNILVTDKNIQNVIDFVIALGLDWFIAIEWNTVSMFSQQIYTLYIRLR
jgi:hypothetical protein